MSHLPRKDNKGMYYYGKTPFISCCQDSDGPSEPTKYFLFLFYFKCPDVGMECEVWLEKSFYEIIKVERWSGGGGGHLKSNDGYLESSLEISAFHYIVQKTKQMTTQWRFVFAGILSTVVG